MTLLSGAIFVAGAGTIGLTVLFIRLITSLGEYDKPRSLLQKTFITTTILLLVAGGIGLMCLSQRIYDSPNGVNTSSPIKS
jgi:hypothetical protein